MREITWGSDGPAQWPFQSPQAGRHQLFQAAQSFADAGAGAARMPNSHAKPKLRRECLRVIETLSWRSHRLI